MTPVFFINLDRSPDRLAFMQAQLKRLGISAHRVRGIDGTDDLPLGLTSQFAQSHRLTPGEVGCYASHLTTYWNIIASQADAAIVLEDDATLSSNFLAVARAAILAAPHRWDVIHFTSKFRKRPLTLCGIGNGSDLVLHRRLPAGGGAYAISRSGCHKMMALTSRKRPIDMEFRYPWVAGLNLYGVSPAPAEQREQFPTLVGAVELASSRRRGYWAPSLVSQIRGKLALWARLGLSAQLGAGHVQ